LTRLTAAWQGRRRVNTDDARRTVVAFMRRAEDLTV
jgi:hypothetical protein